MSSFGALVQASGVILRLGWVSLYCDVSSASCIRAVSGLTWLITPLFIFPASLDLHCVGLCHMRAFILLGMLLNPTFLNHSSVTLLSNVST